MKFKLYYFVIAIIVAACSTGSENTPANTIEIDLSQTKEVNLSDFIEEIKYVKLKTPDIPLGEGLIKIRKNNIYYWDFQQKIFCVFDHQGNMVSMLDKIGEGPGEYSFPIFYEVPEDESYLEIWDKSNSKIIRYSTLDFRPTEEISLENPVNFTSAIQLPNDNYLLSANQALNFVNNQRTNAEFYLIDRNGDLKETYFDRMYKDEDKRDIIRYSLFKFKLIENEAGDIFGSVNYDNTLYQYTDNTFKPALEVKFTNGNSINNDQMLKMSKMEHMRYFTQSDDFVKKASFPNYEVNNSQAMLVNYLYKERADDLIRQRTFIDLKDSGKKVNAKKLVNDLSAFPPSVEIGFTNNDTYIHCNPWFKDSFVSVISPETFLDYEEKIEIEGIGK